MDPQTAALEREHEAVSANCCSGHFLMVSVCILKLIFYKVNLCKWDVDVWKKSVDNVWCNAICCTCGNSCFSDLKSAL